MKQEETKKIKTLIIDDSQRARRLLKIIIEENISDVLVLGEASNVEEAFLILKNTQIDLLLLDIEMPNKTGLQLAQELLDANISCEIIFTTAYNQYAIQAFRLSAIDYLLKPIQENDLIAAIEKVKQKKEWLNDKQRLKALTQNLDTEKESKICLPMLNGYQYMDLDSIEYLEADGSYVKIYLIDGKNITISKNLKYFEDIFEKSTDFLRIHRSFIVHKKHVKKIQRGKNSTVIMQNNSELEISRNRKDEILDAFGIQ